MDATVPILRRTPETARMHQREGEGEREMESEIGGQQIADMQSDKVRNARNHFLVVLLTLLCVASMCTENMDTTH